MLEGKTYWLVGASEGLGRALAAELDAAGARLVLSARSAERLESLAGTLKGEARVVPCDVADPASVRQARQQAGEIDGLVYIAALYEPTPAQAWDAERVEAMGDINFMGALRVLGQTVPGFVARELGHIVLIGSLAGYRGLPGSIGYGSSKAALMHLAESLRADLDGSGVKVQLFNPGFIRTRLTDKNDFSMPFLMEPGQAARHVRQGMEKDAFRTDFPWLFSLVFRLSRLLPQPLYAMVFHRR